MGENMSLLFLCLVIFTAVVGFFSQELQHVFKRIFSIPGAKLCLPMMFASWIVENYALWGYKGLSSLKIMLLAIEHRMAAFLPFHIGALMVARVLVLAMLAMIPLWLIAFLTRKNHLSGALYWAYCCSASLWAVAVILS